MVAVVVCWQMHYRIGQQAALTLTLVQHPTLCVSLNSAAASIQFKDGAHIAKLDLNFSTVFTIHIQKATPWRAPNVLFLDIAPGGGY